MMRRSNPFEEIERMFERMSRQFDEMSRGFDDVYGDRGMMGGMAGRMSGMGGISVDVSEADGEIVVVADLPGFEKEDIDLTVSERLLTIAAEREHDSEEGDGEYLRRERRSESLRRTITLPEAVDEERSNASYTNGVLTVTLPKLSTEEGDEGRHIDIA